MKNAKQYFENTKVEKLYFTSDNFAFFDEQNAKNHASKLDDPAITGLTRDEVYSEIDEFSLDNWEDEMEELLDDLDDTEL